MKRGRSAGIWRMAVLICLVLAMLWQKEAVMAGIASDLNQTHKEEGVELLMVGDNLLHDQVSACGRQSDGSYNFDFLFEHVAEDVKQADVAMINEEVILGGTQLGISGYPTFNGAFEVGRSIYRAGFDVALQATNHALDKGSTGLLNNISLWEKVYPVQYTGINKSQEDQDRILVVRRNGIRIAILNYTYGTNGIPLPSGMPYAVNYLDKAKIARDVQYAKRLSDFIVICPHWGVEYNTSFTADQAQWAQYFADLGIDLCIGTHPHVVEPVRWVTSGNHKMLCYYSLGNFVNATGRSNGAKNQMLGGMAKVWIKKNSKGEAVIGNYWLVPLINHWPINGGKITTYKASDYSPKLASQSRIYSIDSSFTYSYIDTFFKSMAAEGHVGK